MATKPQKQDPLDQVVALGHERALALVLWKARMRDPNMAVQITPEDVQGFNDCVAYLKVKPVVKVYRPAGLPAQEAVPAGPRTRAIPARAAQPPKPYVMVVLTDEKGDAIVPVENNEADFERRQELARLISYRENAGSLAGQLLAQARTGEYSLATMQEAADALVALARASTPE